MQMYHLLILCKDFSEIYLRNLNPKGIKMFIISSRFCCKIDDSLPQNFIHHGYKECCNMSKLKCLILPSLLIALLMKVR